MEYYSTTFTKFPVIKYNKSEYVYILTTILYFQEIIFNIRTQLTAILPSTNSFDEVFRTRNLNFEKRLLF